MSNNNFNFDNLILKTDSYKTDHWEMLPDGAQYLYSYIESRGSDQHEVRGIDVGYTQNVFYGLQAILKRHFSGRLTMKDVDEAQMIIDGHMGPGVFNRAGWERIVTEFDGKLPLRIRAVKEGTVLPTRNVLVTVENTHPDFAWLVSYFEPLFLQVWYPTTVASLSYSIRQVIETYFDLTVDEEDAGAKLFKLHDFGFRGVSSNESARIGGSAHLVAGWMGTDTIQGMLELNQFYKAPLVSGYSVRASEHSVVCANSNAEKRDDYAAIEKMVSILEQNKGIVACVADTYSVRRFAQWVSSDFKDRIINSGGTFVVRPDSGDPRKIPVEIIEILMEGFGYTVNKKGFKVLPSCIRVLQGDGINESTIRDILGELYRRGIAADNIVFGMGGALLQHCDRDWFKFAMKGSALCVDGEWRDLFKDPDTDSVKRSKKGRVVTFKDSEGNYFSDREELVDTNHNIESQMVTVWENGELLVDLEFDEIRVK
jgi:nicotinamide phosphoribosyltransferase